MIVTSVNQELVDKKKKFPEDAKSLEIYLDFFKVMKEMGQGLGYFGH